MKRTLLFVLLAATIHASSFAKNETDSISIKLNKVMNDKEYYMELKEQKIQHLRQVLTIEKLQPEQIYDIHLKLYEEYKKYKSDSAVFYVLKNQEIAGSLKQKELVCKADLQLAWLYSSRGMYIESKALLEAINKDSLSAQMLSDYYETYCSFYIHYGQSNDRYVYYKKSELYRDSLLSVLDPQSLQYHITYATKILYEGQKYQAKEIFLSLLEQTTDKDPERALIAYFIGRIYKETNNPVLEKKYFSISAISDIENSIKDNASLQSLALAYYQAGDIDKAYACMQFAINDAVFCNVRYRTVEASAFYPIINTAYQEKERKQKADLQLSLILISVLSVSLIVGIVYVYKQMKKLSRVRKELHFTNQRLEELIRDLSQVNNNLQEANHIKEEYIAHFFDICSAYINKLETYRKTLLKKVTDKQLDELTKILRSNTLVDNELDDLYKKFDTIFISLYPSFVDQFNSLIVKEEQIILKSGELLNTELRVFALIRLGITDSVKIASFLRYSLSTIYNYRTKARNKSMVPRDQFEEMVMRIGNVNKNN